MSAVIMRRRATEFFCLLMYCMCCLLLEIKFSLQSHQAVDDSDSKDIGPSQGINGFTKYPSSLEAKRCPPDCRVRLNASPIFNYNTNRPELEDASSMRHANRNSVKDFQHATSRITKSSKEQRFATKSSQSWKLPLSKKSKRLRYIKSKANPKVNSLREKHTGKMSAGVRQEHLRSRAFGRERKKISPDGPVRDKWVKTEAFKHLPSRTNGSPQTGKTTPEPEADLEDAQFAHKASTSESSSGGTLLAANEDVISNQLKQMHTELIKLKILQLLRLDSPPNITKPLLRVPPHFLKDVALRDEPPTVGTSDSTQPSEAVIFADQEMLACPHKSAKCVNFALNGYSGRTVVSAELWVYKEKDFTGQRNHTLVVYELDEPDKKGRPRLRLVADALETNVVRGWIKFRLKNTVNSWLDKPHRNRGLQISCKTCKTGSDRITPITSSRHSRPVLILRFSERHRVPRSAPDHCHSKNKVCCKQKLKIDFREIGWDWIVHPRTIETGYCRGSCVGANRIPTIGTHHSALLKWFPESKLQICCAPTRMRPVSILTVDKAQNYLKHDMELVVEECGCVF